MRYCQTQVEDETGSGDFYLPPSFFLSHSPVGFSQMEVAQHSRPALHNLRMKEGGSASHYTRFNPERGNGEAHK